MTEKIKIEDLLEKAKGELEEEKLEGLREKYKLKLRELVSAKKIVLNCERALRKVELEIEQELEAINAISG